MKSGFRRWVVLSTAALAAAAPLATLRTARAQAEPAASAAEAAAPEPPRFDVEYKVVKLDTSNWAGQLQEQKLTETLNREARDGWHLVSLGVDARQRDHFGVFERPLRVGR
jgi:hypothetical protein